MDVEFVPAQKELIRNWMLLGVPRMTEAMRLLTATEPTRGAFP